ncbi:MAG: RHS repeat protein [Mediterranea sp.]|nr:RHS repeat protein [Mediterranea sp.]
MRRTLYVKRMAMALWVAVAVGNKNCSILAQDFIPNTSIGYYFSPKNLGYSTPQTAELTKYKPARVDYYNGLLSYEIPLMEYKDAAFDIPISIKYISDGFKPGRRPSVVGNNWSLNVGGVITRNVYGEPDDIKAGDKKKEGLLVGIRDKKYRIYSKSTLYALDKTEGDLPCDYAPDIFNFSFGEHKGQFFIGNDEQVKCTLGEGYKVDISGMSTQEYSTKEAVPANSTINITTPDGYVYEFGGSPDYFEYNTPNNPKEIEASPVQITAWFLKSIKSPNTTQTVTFRYGSCVIKNRYKLFLAYIIDETVTINARLTDYFDSFPNPQGNNKCILMEDKLKSPILSAIEIGNTHIDFTYSNFGSFWGESYVNDLPYLTEIKEYNTQNILHRKYTKLKYDQTYNAPYFFLREAIVNGQDKPEIYSFDYKLMGNLPNPLTISIDHWGFWNGGYALEENALDYLNNINVRKATNTDCCDIGMLCKIVSPTKGVTNITYEYNRYTSWEERNLDEIEWETKHSGNALPCGGVRIKSLEEYDPVSGKSIIHNFSYCVPYMGVETGFITELPKYKFIHNSFNYYVDGTVWIGKILYSTDERHYGSAWSSSSNTLSRRHNVSELHIGYSDVVDQYNDGSKVWYHFSSMADIPDDRNLNGKIRGTNNDKIPDLLFQYNLYNGNDLSDYRGQLLSKTVYSSTGKLLSKDSYTYNIDEATKDYEVSITYSPVTYAANRVFTTPCRLVKEVHTDNTDYNNVTVIKEYSYNAKNLMATKQITKSDGDKLALSYYYPFDNFPVTLNVGNLPLLTQLNKISEPILILKTKQSAGQSDTKTLSAIKFNYGDFNGHLLKDKLYEWNTNSPNSLISGIKDGSFTLKEQYLKYDDYGNIMDVVKNEHDESIYLWSYSGLYPVAEIKGASYSEVQAALGLAPESLSQQITPNMELINSLRSKLPAASITTYTYSPLIGLTSSTNPQGSSTYYEYDEAGRLSASYIIRNGNKEYLQKYVYQYDY